MTNSLLVMAILVFIFYALALMLGALLSKNMERAERWESEELDRKDNED